MSETSSRDTTPEPAVSAPDAAAIGSRFLRYLPFITIAHFLIGLPALIASLALAYFAFVQADATQKMQSGGVMPFVTFGTSNGDKDGNQDIALSLTNNGVGPAILGPIEIRYEGKPITTPIDLLTACCTGETQARAVRFSTSPSTGIAVRPGETIEFVSLPRTPASEKIWQTFNKERWKLKVRACYCSIFNDCWVTEGMQGLPKAVNKCPANWSLYREDARNRIAGANAK
ncbi:hypothetical protein ATE68_18220 [Sphingopyxis sp. H038]|uniref:hypothetical protein n=1 Tax=unclassified Sphingopyxis TaxID=2614943 RepID=UPI0007306396|nr:MULTISPECIES: hypothetical protein [unclassified Sphingopyxis]KTE00367.1 hypothetical protein ATE78_19470 [Sphingopyxis sp. H012]KTE06640.1 hypothetical protein ATE70_21720 [Sphingopyxis sp. H053]KTE08861.1 hypothetical protein ATE76_15400 [Sphingopyxis sp. H093]KTE28769.1 hypothetical protein ATE75_09865 [Sphingopyxis sp. H080]KTE32686.1 hypothetical protein ATE68_18220 [Sphingopyxis sp. H038]